MLDAAGQRGTGMPDHVPKPEEQTRQTHPSCVLLLYGCDLYVQDAWWEACEARESIWHETKLPDRITAGFPRGLVQMAACAVKYKLTKWLDRLELFYSPCFAPDAVVRSHDPEGFPYIRPNERRT
jgi:hypothetical protein